MYQIIFFEHANGKKPAKNYIESLNAKMKAKAIRSLELLSEFGNQLPMPYSRPLGDGLYELRICFAGNQGRVFYFFILDETIILTNGFTKTNKAMQNKEIEIARKYKNEYENK